MLRAVRIVAALAVFVGINLFFLGFAEGMGILARIQFVPACLAFNLVALGVLVAVTAIAGRLYCSVICPLGILQDIALWMRRRFRNGIWIPRSGWCRAWLSTETAAVWAGGKGSTTVF